MPSALLTASQSLTFRDALRTTRKHYGWSLNGTAKLLRCSRRAVCHWLADVTVSRIRVIYASRLSSEVGYDVLAKEATDEDSYGLNPILSAWHAADDAFTRRREAWRLASYLSERAVLSLKMVTESTLTTTSSLEPLTLTLLLRPPQSTVAGVVVVYFDPRNKEGLDIEFFNIKGGAVGKYNLTKPNFLKILKKIMSWHKQH